MKLSQTAFGEAAQATKWTVINWEKGDSAPDASQLAALAEKGLDVLYVTTGQRNEVVCGVVPVVDLPAGAAEKINALDAAGKKALMQMVDALLAAGRRGS